MKFISSLFNYINYARKIVERGREIIRESTGKGPYVNFWEKAQRIIESIITLITSGSAIKNLLYAHKYAMLSINSTVDYPLIIPGLTLTQAAMLTDIKLLEIYNLTRIELMKLITKLPDNSPNNQLSQLYNDILIFDITMVSILTSLKLASQFCQYIARKHALTQEQITASGLYIYDNRRGTMTSLYSPPGAANFNNYQFGNKIVPSEATRSTSTRMSHMSHMSQVSHVSHQPLTSIAEEGDDATSHISHEGSDSERQMPAMLTHQASHHLNVPSADYHPTQDNLNLSPKNSESPIKKRVSLKD